MPNAAVIVAAGRGVRFGAADRAKQFLLLAGKSVLAHSIELFERLPEFDRIQIVLPADAIESVTQLVDLARYRKEIAFAAGGARRQDSVFAGLAALPRDTEIVAIHDAVRPLAAPEAVAEAVRRARAMGGAILAAPAVDTPKRCGPDGRILETLARRELWLAQTPQVFRYALIRRAYAEVIAAGIEVTDDAAAVERLGEPVEVVRALRPNPKITTPDDLAYVEWLVSRYQTGGKNGAP
jgi:2-C-methyl-D-erythritol 4-phosphate cytidylyltransferase